MPAIISCRANLASRLIEKSFEYIERCSGKTRHVSFLVRRNKILSVGWNSKIKSHPLSHKFKYWNGSVHSELHAITRFRGSVSDISTCDLWNVRIDRIGDIRLSKPCIKCMKLLIAFKVRNIYYTNNLGEFEQWN
jgi:tRNA(Arg) A34 adenosine deaminase TadA